MRSSESFIEVTGSLNGKKFLINKRAITFITQEDDGERAVILMNDGDKMKKILTKETYRDISEEIFWNPNTIFDKFEEELK